MINVANNGKHILVIDDEPLVRRSLSELLTLSGYTVSTASNGKEGLSLLNDFNADIIITDLKMPEMSGLELLHQVKQKNYNIPVILITGYASIENAVEAMRQGAYDYVTKPIVDSEIKIVIERLIKQKQIQEENNKLREQLSAASRERFHDIVGKSQSMQKIYNLIEAVIHTRASVLIHGESGTGKHLIAHAIHKYNEYERGKPLVEVSCGALTETLLESELFGHVRGAFTGAIKDKIGRFELANGGTIFLDEIDAFSPALQVKLLRVLQEGEFERVGDTKTVKVDVRVIAATNTNLQGLIEEGKFRTDLFYRLNIISIEVPPLRDRREDIPLLANDFIKKHSKHTSKKIEGLSKDAMVLLMHYSWPGNIRELENVIERAIILSKGPKIIPADLPESVLNFKSQNQDESIVIPVVENGNGLNLKDALSSPEKELIVKALETTGWNRNETASKLGINRTTLYKKMKKFGLLRPKHNAA